MQFSFINRIVFPKRINITSASLDDSGWYVCIAIQGSRAIRSQPAQVRVTARSTAVSGGGECGGWAP